MKNFSCLIIFMGLVLPVLASHIVGGEMIYEYVGPGALRNFKKYKITLKLFRDEFSTGAPMPTDVFIGIFDGINQYPALNLPYDISKTREEVVQVNPFPSCVVNADSISYNVGIYEFVVDLPDNVNGYTAAFQTCCRVDLLANITNSTTNGTGSTYSCYIPPTADSSPKFSTNVSLICRARQFTLDFSAKDPDSDSLVYSFCNAYDGGEASGSANINPAPAPYISVIYDNGYSAVQPLGRLVTIDSKTGIISGVAPDAGKYVVCVCVQSYKNGKLIGEHRKDFIVKIGECDFAGAQLQLRPVSCDGFNVNFSNENNSPLNETFFWDFGDPASGALNTSTLQTPAHIYSDTGVFVYKLVINRNQPCGDSTSQTIKVYPGVFPGFKWTGQCINKPVQFTDTSTSRYGVINSWSWNFGDPSTLADTSHSPNTTWSFPNAGNSTVSLIVGTSKGCIDTIQVPVPIITNPVVTSLFKDTTYCGKDTIQLQASANVAGSFSWTPNTKILNANTANPLVFPVASTRYVVKFDAGGCTGTDTVNVNPKSDLTVSITPASSGICEEDTVILSAVSNHNNINYLWGPATTLTSATAQNPKASPVVSTTYTVLTRWGNHCTSSANTTITVKNLAIPDAGADTFFCAGNPGVMLDASGGNNYVWAPSAGLTNAGISNPVANPAFTTDYVVSVGVTGCTKRRKDTVSVVLRNLPVLTITNDTLICSIDTLQLSASAPGATKFSWSPNYIINNQNTAYPLVSPDVPVTYLVQVTDGYKCISRDSVFVDVKKFVTINAGNDTTICQTDAIKLNTISDALNYSWSPSSTLDNATAKFPFATPLTTTTYHVTGNIGKCRSDDDIKITVVPYPKANAGNDTTICFNSFAILHASGGNNYAWSPATDLSDPGIPDPVSVASQNMQYIVTVTDDKGCPKPVNDTVILNIFPKIIANAGRDTAIVIKQPLQLHGTGGQVYLWSPSQGLSNVHIADPVAMLNNNQQYILKASNSIGCNGTDTINITVYKVEPGLYIPNAFSPNGDNLNDVFRPVQLGIKFLRYFKIFNRFGQLLFSTNQNLGWDGNFKGRPQNPDVYVWIAAGVDYNNTEIFKKGTVTLTR